MKLDRGTFRAPDLTVEQAREICYTSQKNGLKTAGLGAEMRPPFSEKLAGKVLTIKFGDHPELTYKFDSAESLEWSEAGSPFKKEYCQTMELYEGSNLFYLNHVRSYTFPTVGLAFIIDMDKGLVTLVHASIGGNDRIREVDRSFHFGYIANEGGTAPQQLHDFTKEMEDLIIDWNYDKKGSVVARHIYVNHKYKFDRILINGATINCTGMYCDYVKIRDNIYIMSWIETNTQGVQGCALIDLRDRSKVYDVGSFFGINRAGNFESYTFGAKGVIQEHI